MNTDDKSSRPDVGKPRLASGGYSAAELAGEFPDLRSWSQPIDQRGDTALTWRTTELSATDINSYGGRQAARDGMFSLSYYTYGYTLVHSRSLFQAFYALLKGKEFPLFVLY